MHRSLTRVPLPAAGYVLTLVGFAFLGLFVAALGFGSDRAAVLGVAMAGSYAVAALCFALRRRQIAVADPTGDVVLGLDPIRGNTDRSAAQRYLLRYRGQDTTQAVAATPVARAADSSDGPRDVRPDNRFAAAA
ncbi:Uncharacterised protein [Mycolicibacterium vanbaalenii]|mgnify:CR=1 FL=1|uniref:Transmembrane protein n=1 Tax=Mycolicibacterium vanbaalenii TaxID=110539 RepID=A0A5S9R028_MYCVN|nr:hypothetical protein [Mycolicibacterium vanbaalenii]CAA0124843.1 Uncharacterised protein [Mycolicibacterium vanbaalenii]